MTIISTFLDIIAFIVFVYFIYCGYKWFRLRHNKSQRHYYTKHFWYSVIAYVVLSFLAVGFSPGGGSSSHQAANHSKKTAAVYHNTGNAHENFLYFKNHAIHKFSDYSVNHPYQPSDGPEDNTTANGAHWSNSDGAFVIDTGADAHSTADKHVQAEACFYQFKHFMKKYEPMSDKNWDGSVVFQDNYGDEITTGNATYKHLSENGMGFDD